MNTNKKTARIAGALYLVVVVSGIFHLMYVPSKLMDWDNPSLMINNISNSETLFRLGIISGLICYIAFLILPLALYKLLSSLNKTHAVLMVALAVVSVPISLVNLLNKFAVLTLLSKAKYLSAVDVGQLHAQILLHLDYSRSGNQLASIFWGLWLFPFGYLVFRSGFLPKVLGILLMAGCVGDVINFIGEFLFAGYEGLGISDFMSVPGSLGEIGICLWLLTMGVKMQTGQSEQLEP